MRVNFAYNTSVNALNGDLYIAEQDTLAAGLPTTAARVHGKIDIGMEQMHSATYSVPRRHVVYVSKGYLTINSPGACNLLGQFFVAPYQQVARSQYVFGVDANASSSYIYDFAFMKVATERSDIRVVAETVTVDDTDVSAGYEFILEDLRAF